MADTAAAAWLPTGTPAPGPTRPDAYLPWAQATDFSDARPEPVGPGQPWVRVLLGLKSGCTAQAFATALARQGQRWLWVPGHYRKPPQGLVKTSYCTAVAHRDFLARLATVAPAADATTAADPLAVLVAWAHESIDRFEIGFEAQQPDFEAAVVVPLLDPDQQVQPDVKVVVGVIDDGLAFANRRFCVVDAQGRRRTRLLGLWDQGADTGPCDTLWGRGRLHSRLAIDEYLSAAGQGCTFDEDAAYWHACYREVRHRVTHGTHVMDLACGADATPDGPPAPHIVGVQLPPVAISDTSCASMTPYLLDAIRYIVSTADAAAGHACPVVVNCSMGNIAGPHDGSSMLESAVDELIKLRREVQPCFEVVLPEGNSLQSQTHAWAQMDMPRDEFSLDWCIKPDDGTSSFLELWFRPRLHNQSKVAKLAVELTVTPPGAGPEVRFTLDLAVTARPGPQKLVSDGQTLALCGLYANPANGRHPMGLLTVAPTACYGPWSHRAPSGAWRITVKNLGRSIYCNVYVQRDDVAFGRGGRGRQGKLDDTRAALASGVVPPSHYERFEKTGAPRLRDDDDNPAFVRRVGTINGLATGDEVQVVGGVQVGADGLAVGARYSSVAIPTTRESVLKARLLAVTEDSALLHGVLAAGSRSGACVALSGTSTAAPQRAREIAQGWLPGRPRSQGQAVDAEDANHTLRSVVTPSADLASRSQRRRGPSAPALTTSPAAPVATPSAAAPLRHKRRAPGP